MKVLFVEDNLRLASLTTEGLRLLHFIVDATDTAEQALYLTSVETYDVIVLDRMLPGNQDGLDVCKKLRERGNTTPILLLTALGDLNQRVAGLSGGADDYLVKPFALAELAARIKALSRRKTSDNTASTVIKINNYSINIPAQKVLKDNREIHLSKRLWSLLEYLALHRGQTINKARLIDHVWGVDRDILDNTVEASIWHLRQKLGDKKGDIIQTVHGFGYRITV